MDVHSGLILTEVHVHGCFGRCIALHGEEGVDGFRLNSRRCGQLVQAEYHHRTICHVIVQEMSDSMIGFYYIKLFPVCYITCQVIGEFAFIV